MESSSGLSGPQPLDLILTTLGVKNSDLVRASTEQLTHKMVAKGRKGRRLTRNVQEKIRRALNACQTQKEYTRAELFSY